MERETAKQRRAKQREVEWWNTCPTRFEVAQMIARAMQAHENAMHAGEHPASAGKAASPSPQEVW